MTEQYRIAFEPYYDMPKFVDFEPGFNGSAEYIRLFMKNGKWDEQKIYAARIAYVEEHGLDPQKYNVRPWHLSTWQGPIPSPVKKSTTLKKSARTLDFAGPRHFLTTRQRRRIVLAATSIGLAMRSPIKNGDDTSYEI